ncbi:MAG TPA: PaaI family thioesterase [Dehalococcoidia bacterium]|nr:PaaI family thioesterase [Dehalococcoidia bacterium]
MTDRPTTDTDAEALERVKRRWESDPYLQLLGLEVVDFAPGRATLRLPLSDRVLNGGQGVAHGGALCSAMDIAIGIALNAWNATAGEGPIGQTTTDINVSFLAGAREGPLTIEAEIVRRGGTLAVGDARVRDARGELAAVGRATFMIIRRDR